MKMIYMNRDEECTEIDVPYYDSLLIIEKTKGVMAEDHQLIKIIEE